MRFLSGWRLPVLVAAIASLLILPFITATLADPTAPGKPARVTEEQSDLDGLPIEQKAFFARSSYVWEYATGPYYGKVEPGLSRAPGTLVTPVGSFRLTEGELPFPQELRTAGPLATLGDQYFIVQFAPDTGGVNMLRELLASRGRTTVASMPVAAHVAKLDAELLESVQKLPGVIAIEPFHAAIKFSPSLGRVPLADAEKAISSVYSLVIDTWQGEDSKPVVEAIESMGGKVISVAANGKIVAELHRSKLRALSKLEAVGGISEYYDGQLRDEKAATTMQTGAYNEGALPYHDAGIDGSGGGVTGVSYQVAMVIDSGLKLDAGDLSDTRTTSGVPGTDPGNADPSGEHRKVLAYETTDLFGGKGDLKGCDTVESGQFTHGHFVASTLLGNASANLPGSYGAPYLALDKRNPLDTKQWNYIGVAPGAKLVFYDAQRVPGNGTCGDPLLGSITAPPGMLYGGTAGTGVLGTSYTTYGARVFNLSWGANVNEYSFRAAEIDEFIFENPEAMVFIAVGNAGLDENSDGIPDLGSLGEPATAKNGVAVGMSFSTNNLSANGNEEFRSTVSSTGPEASSDRIAPQLMAPGTDVAGSLGPRSSYACKTADNEQTDPVECDLLMGKVGTSIAAPAAAGAAVLARDYFTQGFYPSGAQNDADRVTSVSGALVKALLVASTDFMNGQTGAGLFERYRVNNEQGWGRIQLDEVLPLQSWTDAPKGLVVVDGAGSVPNLLGGTITGTIDATTTGSQSATFQVRERDQELRLALVYTEAQGPMLNGAMMNDLDLVLEAPSGKFYIGNYFTDDENRDRVIDLDTEDCPSVVGAITGELDASQWSQPICEHACNATASCPVGQEFSRTDPTNPIEMIALSPDYDGDGVTLETDFDPLNDNQLEVGTWTVYVNSNGGGNDATQDYALVIAGSIFSGPSISFDSPSYPCAAVYNPNTESPRLEVIDTAFTGNVNVQVYDSLGAMVDQETGAAFNFVLKSGTNQKHQTDMLTLTDGLARQTGNGVLDVRDGDTLMATYTSASSVVRTATAKVECAVKIASVGQIQFSQWGQDSNLFVNGGCERNGRGQQDTWIGAPIGAPDAYMDAGERIVLDFGFTSNESETMTSAVAELRCVLPDGNSPAGCTADSNDCADPRRLDNPDCGFMTITNTPIVIGSIPSGVGLSANFNIVMNDTISGTQDVEMVLDVSARLSGKAIAGSTVRAVTLNADENSILYSTDYPMGGTELQDRNNNELIEDPLTLLAEVNLRDDLRFETVAYSPIFGTSGTKNLGLQSPWSFDLNDGGFRSGLNAITDFGQITDNISNWGEDINFNNQLDYFCSLNETARLPGGQPGCDPTNDQCANFQTCVGGFCSVTGESCTGNPDCDGGVCTSFEDREETGDPGVLDQNWSTAGGCGWQTKQPGNCSVTASQLCFVDADCPASESCNNPAAAQTGGAWHTGSIGNTTGPCELSGVQTDGQCEFFETVGGDTRQFNWVEMLVTPEVQRVGDSTVKVQITNWAWNMAIDLPDNNAWYSWEFDTDSRAIEPVELFSDLVGAGQGFGSFGGVSGGGNAQLNNGWNLFAPMSSDGSVSQNGTVGNNRVGKNSCFFEGALTDESLKNSSRCVQSVNVECISESEARSIDGLSDPRDDDLKNGLCTHNDQIVCRQACSEDLFKPCNSNADCSGTCDSIGADCAPAPRSAANSDTSCTTNADCTAATGGRCVGYEGNCTQLDADDNPIPCLFNDECEGFLNFCINRVNVCTYPCDVGGSAIDEFVTPAGPMRNIDMQAWNGPDLRFFTLEDAWGDTGEFFQAGIGFRVREPDSVAGDAAPGYGLGVDDMVIEWREFTLVEDATDCTPTGTPGQGGDCAVLDVASSNFFEGNALMTVTVLENSPSPNDCDCDGTPDSPDDFDCDDDGTPDVAVKAQNPLSEPAGECIIANRTSDPSGSEYVGVLPISASYNSPGVLFLQQIGTTAPFVEFIYLDADDGTGQKCLNSTIVEQQGRVTNVVSVNMVTGNLKVTGVILFDGQTTDSAGDADGFADTNETVEMRIKVTNSTGVNLQGITARLSSNDPKVDCILKSEIAIGDIPAIDPANPTADPEVLSSEAFRFRVGNVQRSGVCDTAAGGGSGATCVVDGDCSVSGEFCSAPFELFTAAFNITFNSSGDTAIASSTIPQGLTLDLDLDAIGGGNPDTFSEDFETSTNFGSFVTANLDQSLGSNAAADGYRCQYSNPDWPISNVYGDTEAEQCFPGPATADGPLWRQTYWWSLNSADPNNPSVDGGRAYSGVTSLYFGTVDTSLTVDERNTTPVGMLEGIRSLAPVDLGWANVCEFTRLTACSLDSNCTAATLGIACTGGQCTLSGTPTGNPITCTTAADCNEACVVPTPQLSFKQQVSFMDNPPHGCVGPVQGAGRTADRGVLQVQFAGDDDPVPALAPGLSPWIKVEQSQFLLNGYEIQPADNFISCMFDPIDDGNSEDDWFDATDPNRRLGPSSTCFPEFVWAATGDTDNDFNANNYWRADGPGLQGNAGIGTWVETKVDLARFRGRRLRLRFVQTGINDPTAVTWEELFSPLNPNDCDDGWWIDDILITDTVDAPASISSDTKANTDPGQFPACGNICDAVVADLVADPVATLADPLPAPNLPVELDARTSFPDPKCSNGVLEYEFCIDGNNDALCGDPADTPVRDFTDNPVLLQAPPAGTTTYVVCARCSTDRSCSDCFARDVVVDCPTGARAADSRALDPSQIISAPNKTQFVWTSTDSEFFAEGSLAGVSSYTTSATGAAAGATSHPMSTAEWYLIRFGVQGEFCNEISGSSWTSGGAGESATPGRDNVLP